MVVGSIELHSVPDAVGVLGSYATLYPDVPEESWAQYRDLYPELYSGPDWVLSCKCFLVRSAGTTILVDTGVGPEGLWRQWRARTEGQLPAGLAALGTRPEDVDVVFLTHLHVDHLGWNADRDGTPFFPRARFVVHEAALDFVLARGELPHIQRCVVPLADRFEPFSGELEVAPGVSTVEAPGHFPGHTALRLESEGASAVLLADTAVHPALLHEPDWVYVADGDPPTCAATRRRLLPELVDRDVLVACGHYPGSGIGRIVTRDGRVTWEEEA